MAHWVDLFNRDADLDHLYEPGAVLVPVPGHPVTGQGKSAANAYLMSLGLPMKASVRHCYATGDIALLVVDWSVGDMSGTAADVVRRGEDDRWRYVIDNPSGIG